MDCEEHVYSEDYYDFIAEETEQGLYDLTGICNQRVGGFFRILYVDRFDVGNIADNLNAYQSIPDCYTLVDELALEVSGITRVRDQPNLNLKGQNILMGFIDTGIAYETKAFQFGDGSSRIVSIWDQTVRSGEPPRGFLYGSEFTKADIDQALQSENPQEIVPSTDENGHGTLLASIAAGSPAPEDNFSGAAPLSDIAVVKLKPAKKFLRDLYFIPENTQAFQENDILTAIDYLSQLAAERRQPLVLCLGLGTNQGNHGGNTRLAEYLDYFSGQEMHAVCVAVGNEANARRHYYGKLMDGQERDVVEINVTEDMPGVYMEFWTKAPELFAISVISPTGERLPPLAIRSPQQQIYRFLFEETVISIDYLVVGRRSKDQLIFIRMQKPVAGIWSIEVTPSRTLSGNFDIWLPMTDLTAGEIFFLRSNPDTTLTSPSSAELVMSVGGYQASTGSLYLQSGRGFSTSGAIKPDFIAPAVDVFAQGNRGQYLTVTGTSAAAAIAAGAAALLMEWNVYHEGNIYVNNVEIRNQLIAGARRDENKLYPNREEGYGRLDLYAAFEKMRV